ncbi:MAG TPA: HEPN domain-containing protein [bacterium]|nr:HEPN domain-containing protein [bacterium]
MSEQKNYLKKRAREFWERAEEDLHKLRYNLVALDVEQAVQLWLKHLLWKKVGDFPRTHYLERLLQEISEIYRKVTILKFYERHVLEFRMMEDAYISSHYLPWEFTRKEVKSLSEFAKKFIAFMEKTLNEKFV